MLATLLLLSPLQQSAPICSSSDIPFDWTEPASMSIDGNLAAVGQGRYQDGSLPNFVSLLEVDELGCWNEVERLFDKEIRGERVEVVVDLAVAGCQREEDDHGVAVSHICRLTVLEISL